MTRRSSPWPAGVPCWADIGTPDVSEAQAFYSAVLGWEFSEPIEGYVIAQVDGCDVAAIGPRQAADQPVAWLLYLASDDADQTATAVNDSGGTVIMPPGDVGPWGRMLVAADPSGAVFGVWQSKEHIGARLVNEPGGLTWEDLRSTQPVAAQEFYAKAFGFELREIEMAPGDYRTFHLPGDEAPLGGIGGLMGSTGPSRWQLYFGVASVENAVAAAENAGGKVMAAPFETPYGKMAGLVDPSGGMFQVVETDGSQQPDRSG